MNRRIILIALIVLCLCAVGWTYQQQRTQQQRVKWEYTVYVGKDFDRLDQFGADGWELVSVDVPTAVFFFKRPK